MKKNRIGTMMLGVAVLVALESPRIARGQATSVLGAAEEAKIEKMLADSGVPSVSIAIVEHDRLVYAKAFGKASLDPPRAATAQTIYAIGSISKQFTTAAILLLAEQGKISLDDKVSKYFPGLTRANEVTIRELLSHTSGYEDYAPQDYTIPEQTKPTTPQHILDEWAKKPLNFTPGTKWQYSNTNYVLAGQIFEKASGEDLMKFLGANIFGPLGMTSAVDCSVNKSPQDAVAYTRYVLGPPRPSLREGHGWFFGAGELCMTPTDLAKWDVAFLEKRILTAHSYEEFTREVRLADGDRTHYALGLHVGTFDDTIPMISHSGEVSGFLALNRVFPTRHAAIVVLSNQDAVDLIGPVGDEIPRWILEPDYRSQAAPASPAEIAQVTTIIQGLQRGHIDRSLLTSNDSFYFTAAGLHDIEASLAPLGALKSVTRQRQSLRGGFIYREYTAQFEKKTLKVTVYLTSSGRYEQFLILRQI
ncbi:MAG TPA: serine hydrolase domain-containing protein [Candidatus Acidoferrum sp.]|nr:serine hydrolase domain-containing protein [Candidatus Acidoferrum sp.]